MKSFLVALKFLTIFPVGKKLTLQDEELAKSAIYFPLVGALIGLSLVAVDFVLRPLFPNLIINLFILITLILITGVLHLDGFMDSIDGLFSGQNRNRILEIMRDSKIGAFAVAAVIFLLLLKLSFLNEIQLDIRYSILILMPVLSRWTIVYSAWKYPYARKGEGLGKSLAKLVSKRDLVGTTIFVVILSILLLRLKGILILFIIFGALFLLTKWINKKIGGMTGDTYGAIIETIEVVFLVLVYCINSINLSLYG